MTMCLLKQGTASTLWLIILLGVMGASAVFGEKVPIYRAHKGIKLTFRQMRM